MIYSIEEIRNRSFHIFSGLDFVRAAYLFGSYARGEATAKSDIDIMICTNREVGLEFFGLYELLQNEFHKKVDVITEAESLEIMPRTIARDKILLYEQSLTLPPEALESPGNVHQQAGDIPQEE